MIERDYVVTTANQSQPNIGEVNWGWRVAMGVTGLAVLGGGAVALTARSGEAPAQVIAPADTVYDPGTTISCQIDDCTPDPSNPDGTTPPKITVTTMETTTTPTSEVSTTTSTMPETTTTTYNVSTTTGVTVTVPPTHETQPPVENNGHVG